ncbi:MAG: CHC2 zinc finger domain-containing protein [Candidatus Roizmanbacteria bacterium]|nr:CHC2 zinc finger domain-containing protein [Candidatus Roizmanbacteria bacterium]
MAWIKSIKESKLYTKEEVDQIERINKIYFLLLEQERVKWQADLKENLLKIPQERPEAKHLVKSMSRKQKKFNEQLEIARGVDLESVVEQYVGLRRSSEYRMVGLCPFHSEKTPSFFVYTDDNHYYCFGCCKYGDVIKFIRLVENLTFKQSVRTLYRFSQES